MSEEEDELIRITSQGGYTWKLTKSDLEDLEDNLVIVKPLGDDYWIKGRLSDILHVVRPPGTALIEISQLFGGLVTEAIEVDSLEEYEEDE